MKTCRFIIPYLIVTLAISCTLFGQETISDPNTGKTFPASVNIEFQGKNLTLDATGVATRKKFFVKVYSMAHYMANPPTVGKGDAVFNEIINSKQAKQVATTWLRNVNKQKVRDGYLESFEKIMGRERFTQLRPTIDQFTNLYNTNIKTNDTHTIRWLPNNTVEVYLNNNKQGSVEGEEFARGLWSIWFGSNDVVNRNDLINRLH